MCSLRQIVHEATGGVADVMAEPYCVGPVVATSHIRSEKRHLESVMIDAKQAQRADFLNGYAK
jgi:hypothetical protein